MMWTSEFWKQALERAIKTAAQVAVTFFVIGQTDVLTLDWKVVGSAVIVGFVSSVLTSLGSAPFGPVESPSVVE